MKKGYLRTEQVLRQESAQVDKDGRPIFGRDEYGNEKYIRGFELLSSWIDSNLDIYKVGQSCMLLNDSDVLVRTQPTPVAGLRLFIS
jgi:hypothetical protein